MDYVLLALGAFSTIITIPIMGVVWDHPNSVGFHILFGVICAVISFLFYAIWFEGHWEDKALDILILLLMCFIAGFLAYQPYNVGG